VVGVESEYLLWPALHWAALTLNQAERVTVDQVLELISAG
jgi:hypothetical protein